MGTSTTIDTGNKYSKLHIVFVHLDLGIGGAEQLVLQLAKASQDLGYRVDLVTTRCDPDHCFEAVQKNGHLSDHVFVYGRWIPPNLMGIATAFMSTLRMLHLSLQVIRFHPSADVVVMDVLPTSLPLLLQWLPSAATLFYCHFPDKLLLWTQGGRFKRFYRTWLDAMEESTMALSDTLVVNSKFTLNTVKNHFTSLSSRDIAILYPALDTSKMTSTNQRPKTKTSPIVSLNRFERKKNIGLLIEAFAYLQRQYPELTLPPLIIAGGYDTQNVENVQHRGELGRLATRHQVVVDFRLDISDHDRAVLFQTAMCVVYTPDREHFGIVPLEAMYAGTPVLAVNSGGPTETVVDGRTGFLREATATAFGEALRTLMEDPHKATEMGRAGREHVQRTFGPERFQQEWKDLVEKTVQRGRERMENSQQSRLVLWMNTALYLLEAFVAMAAVLLLTLIMRHLGILEPEQSILGKFRTRFQGDEL